VFAGLGEARRAVHLRLQSGNCSGPEVSPKPLGGSGTFADHPPLVENFFGSLTDRSEYNSRSSKEAELFLIGSDSCACLQEIIQLNARVKPSAHDYRRNLLRIRDIFQRISV